MDVFTAQYEYNGVFYSVDENRGIHEQLQTDPNFAAVYFQENAAATEIVGVAETQESEKQEFVWTKKSTALLIDSYRDRILQFRDPKQKKKTLWGEIVQLFKKHGYRGLTEDIIDRKFRNMKKTFKTIKDNNKKTVTGRGRITWEYFEEFQDLFQNDRTINFGPTISSMQPATLSSPSTPTVSSYASRIDQPSTSYTASPFVQLQSPTTSSPLPESDSVDPEETLVLPPASSSIPNTRKGKRLYELRKKQLDVEERRLEELRRLRESVERSNEIQAERNNILKEILKKL